jgi:hypothetical protein
VEPPELITIYVPLERHDSFIPPLADLGDKVKEAWVLDEATKKAEKAASDYLVNAGNKGWSLGFEGLPPENYQEGQTPLFPRLRFFMFLQPPISQADTEGLLKAIFQLRKTGDLAKDPILVDSPENRGYLALGLADFKAADDSLFTESLETRRTSASRDSTMASFAYWISEASNKVSIKLPREISSLPGLGGEVAAQ